MPYVVTMVNENRYVLADVGGRIFTENGALTVTDEDGMLDAIFAKGEWAAAKWLDEDDA